MRHVLRSKNKGCAARTSAIRTKRSSRSTCAQAQVKQLRHECLLSVLTLACRRRSVLSRVLASSIIVSQVILSPSFAHTTSYQEAFALKIFVVGLKVAGERTRQYFSI